MITPHTASLTRNININRKNIMNRAGDIEITVDKAVLLNTLKENREKHGELYLKAWEGYVKLTRKELEEKLERIKNNKPIDRYLGNNPPEDHTRDYDDVIDMLEMSIGNTIELTQGQFRQYVKDDWGWKEAWTASNTAYLEQ